MSGYILVSIDLGQLMHNKEHKKQNSCLIIICIKSNLGTETV